MKKYQELYFDLPKEEQYELLTITIPNQDPAQALISPVLKSLLFLVALREELQIEDLCRLIILKKQNNGVDFVDVLYAFVMTYFTSTLIAELEMTHLVSKQ